MTRDGSRVGGHALTGRNRIGVVLASLLGLIDVAGLALVSRPREEVGAGPPDGVLVLGAVLGIVTIGTGLVAWVRRSRPALRLTAVSRGLSVLLALPALLVDGVTDGLVAATAVVVLATLVAIALLVRTA